MNDSKDRKPEAPDSTTEPPVVAIKRDAEAGGMTKRSFLRTAVGGLVVGAAFARADSPEKKDDDEDEPPGGGSGGVSFAVGGTTYRITDLKNYNGTLPKSGQNLAIVGYVGSSFFFRSFDAQGRRLADSHESRLADKASLDEIKVLTSTIVAKGSAEAEQQTQFAALFTKVTSSVGTGSGGTPGKRMQGAGGRAEKQGRRHQGSSGSGHVSGRRMQGGEGRSEGDSSERDLGTVVINGKSYDHTKVTATYTDGFSRVTHADGSILVRSDSLPEMVQMQLSIPVTNPTPVPSATPAKPKVVTPSPTPAPPPSTGTRRGTTTMTYTYTYHYWRPN